MSRLRLKWVLWLAATALVWQPLTAVAAPTWHVRLRTNPEYDGQFIWSFTTSDSGTNQVAIENMAANGATLSGVDYQGGPVSGDIFWTGLPADSSTLGGDGELNELSVLLQPLGTEFSCDLTLTETPSSALKPMPQLAFYFLTKPGGADSLAFRTPTADPYGSNALFAIDISGAPGGDLYVFAPMVLVPPDTLLLDAVTLNSPTPVMAGDRIRMRALTSIPSTGDVRLQFDIPSPGGHVRLAVFDIGGRRVATLVDAARAPGQYMETWAAHSTTNLPSAPGMYVARLEFSGQALAQRIVLVQ